MTFDGVGKGPSQTKKHAPCRWKLNKSRLETGGFRRDGEYERSPNNDEKVFSELQTLKWDHALRLTNSSMDKQSHRHRGCVTLASAAGWRFTAPVATAEVRRAPALP
eukprot:1381397-Pleurochrysis_carterae.AAC.4